MQVAANTNNLIGYVQRCTNAESACSNRADSTLDTRGINGDYPENKPFGRGASRRAIYCHSFHFLSPTRQHENAYSSACSARCRDLYPCSASDLRISNAE